MQQLRLNWINDGIPAEEPEFPQGISVKTLSETEGGIGAWLEICEDGLTEEVADYGFYERLMLSFKDYDPDKCFLVFAGGEAVGTFTVICHYAERDGYIHMVGLKSEFRGMGIGTFMNSYSVYVLKKEGMKTAHLTTDDFRIPAIRSYLRAGFVPDETVELFDTRWPPIMKKVKEFGKRQSQLERMKAGLVYDPADPEIFAMQVPCLEALAQYNDLSPSDFAERENYLKEHLAECGENCYIEIPFRANWGGRHVHLGNNVYANFNLTLVDDGDIYIGNNVLIAPNVTIATAGHPLNPYLRNMALQFNRDVHIGNNVWLGAGVIITPGVTVGDNSVIGAGSVVTKDIPEGVVAVGNPCKVIREISDRDRTYYYKNEKIDWENI